jgi:hypothetical protein
MTLAWRLDLYTRDIMDSTTANEGLGAITGVGIRRDRWMDGWMDGWMAHQ